MHALGACGLGSTPSSPNEKRCWIVPVQIWVPRKMKMKKKNFCTLYLIRHGETEWNREKIIMGHIDTPLTETGLRQASELAAFLEPVRFSAVYSSDSPRAVRTTAIAAGIASSSIRKMVELRERDFSRFEGTSATLFREQNKESLLTKDALPEPERWHFKIADCVESDNSIATRITSVLRHISQSHFGETVLVGTHGGPIRFLLVKLGFAPYGSLPSGTFKNCGYVVLESDGEIFTIKEVNGVERHESSNSK